MDDAPQRDHHSPLQEEPRDPPQPDLANAVRIAENLLQTIKDCQRPQPPASQPEYTVSPEEDLSESASPNSPSNHDVESTVGSIPPPSYASLAHTEAQCPSCDTGLENTEIDQCQGKSQPPGDHFADVETLTAKTTKPPSKVDPVQYSGVLPQMTENAISAANEELAPPPLPAKTHRVRPLTSESLFDELHPTVTAQWQKLGKLLGMDEDLLDEIYTNNEADEECLRVMLQLWLRNPRVNVIDALKSIGENELAESLGLKYKLPGEPTEEEGYGSELPKSDEGGSRKPTKPENYQSRGLRRASSSFLALAEEPYDCDEVEVPQEAIESGCNPEVLRCTTKRVEAIVSAMKRETSIDDGTVESVIRKRK